MRRTVARVIVLAVTAAGLLSVTGIVQAVAPKVSPTLSLPSGSSKTAVAGEGGQDQLQFGGSVDPGSALDRAELRFRDSDGNQARQPLDVTGHLSIVGGAITGQYTLPSLCPGHGATPEERAEEAALCKQRLNNGSVVLYVAVLLGGAPGTGTSNGIPIDTRAPSIKSTSLIDTKDPLSLEEGSIEILVSFSEPVHLPAGVEDSETDWFVGGDCRVGRPVIDIRHDGDSRRILTLAIAEDEDPVKLAVDYCPHIASRPSYRDRANRTLTGTGRTSLALDRVAPKVPQVTEIAGRPGKNVLANDSSPIVRMGGLRAPSAERPGHHGRVYLETGGPNSGFELSEELFLAEAPADASGFADVQLPDLGPDGTYVLYGVARDNAKCTSEEDSELCPNYSDGDRVTYRLDTVVPELLFAATDGPRVIVRFSEPVSGTDDPSQWTVTPGNQPSSVTGTGPERFLEDTNAPAGATVTWTRPPTGGYSDDAGNGVESFSTEALDFIPPVITITDPVSTEWTSEASYRVTGSVSKAGSQVEVFRDGSNVQTHQLGPEEKDFAIEIPLQADQNHSFVLRATDSLGNVNRNDTFLPPIIQDSTPPTVSVVEPSEDARLQGGESFTIKWEATDANFRPGPIDIYFSTDGGPGELVDGGGGQANDGEFQWRVPEVNQSGQIRIVATDQVGFTDQDVSGVFTIDALGPGFSAMTIDPHHVAVLFTESVTGTVAADEWTIADVPAADACDPQNSPACGDGAMAARLAAGTNSLLLQSVQELGRNELPEIAYDPGTVPGREQFRDEAGNQIDESARTVRAADGIVPVDPTIETIAGDPAGEGPQGEDNTPEVEIGNIAEGDTADVFVDSDGDKKFTGADTHVGSAVAGEDGATVTTEPLGPDGDYRLFAQASDPSGNRSEGVGEAVYKLRRGILPPIPVIEEIAGQPADAPVTANDPSPDVKVGGIAETFVAEVYADSDGTAGFSPGDRKLGEATADKDGALVQTEDLGPDGRYTLLAVTRNTSGNRSPGADEATYILDATSPAFTATVLDSRRVGIDFTEPVSGMFAEVEWKIDGVPSNTTRPPGPTTGLTGFSLETLEVQRIDPGASPEISYGPVGGQAGSPAPAELRDKAGNWIETKVTRAAALREDGQPGGGTGGEEPAEEPAEEPSEEEGQTEQQTGDGPGVPPGGLVCTIVGTAGNDILIGTQGPDVICPLSGADSVVALGGKDVVFGGPGPKLIQGGKGSDLLIGGNRPDRIYGGKGRDRLFGKGRSDRLVGGGGKDKLVGAGGKDKLIGGGGKDKLNGGPGRDKCKGGPGKDALRRCERGRS